MSVTRFPMAIIKNEESMEDPDEPLSFHKAARVHKQGIHGQTNNIHSLSGDLHQKYQATTPTEKGFHHNHQHHPYHLQSPEPSHMSAASPLYQQTGSPFLPPSRSSQLSQYPFNSPPIENQIYKTDPQDTPEGTQVAHGLDNFVNMYAQQQQHQQQEGQRQIQHQNIYGYPVNNTPAPIDAWGYQPSPSPIYMSSERPQAQPSQSTPIGKRERFDEPSYIDELFAPQEAFSFTWDIKEDRTIPESHKPKRRKLTASERARTKALKLAGGACDNCRRKKKKCTHKDLSELNSLGEGQSMDGNLAQRHDKPPTTTDRDVQSRLCPYSGPNNSVLAYVRPEDDPGMHTPSGTPSYVGENFNVPEFPLDSAGLDQQFDHQSRPSNYDQGHQGHQEGGDNHHESGIWYNVMGYNADCMLHQYHQG